MRYFYAAPTILQYGGWHRIEYIGFPSVGNGTIYHTDGSTDVFIHDLSWALGAVANGDWVEVFPVDPMVAQANEAAFISTEPHEDEFLAGLLDGGWDTGSFGDESDDRDFLITATVQFIVRAEDRVIARLIAAETLRDYIADSPYPNDVMNGLTVDDVEDLMEED